MPRENPISLNEASGEYETIKARARGRRNEEEDLDTVEADIDSFFEDSDEHPGDRRRDPLRRGL